MQLTSRQKKGLGIVLMVIFIPIQLLCLTAFLYILFTGEEGGLQMASSYLFVMALFFFPLWLGYRLWKAGRNQLRNLSMNQDPQRLVSDPARIIKLHVKIELPEYRKMIFRISYSHPAIIFIHILGIAFLISYLFNDASNWLILIIVFFVLFPPLSIYLSANSNYKSTKMLHEPVEYEFTHETINTTGASFSSTMQWKSLYKVRELKDWFLLYTNKQVAMLIPKTAFTSSDDMEVFRRMTAVVRNE